MKKRTVALLCAAMMIVGIAAGGTLAWLVDDTTTVKNVFTTSDVNIGLDESDDLDLKMVPGKTITKDPEVTVVKGSLDCYVFVKIEKSANYDTFLEPYAVAAGWQKVSDVEGDVYYREVTQDDTQDQIFNVLLNDQVEVKDTVTKAMMEGLTEDTYPTLSFTAYAIQKDYLTDDEGNDLTTTDMAEIYALASATQS